MGLLFGRFWSRFFSKRTGHEQCGATALETLQTRLHALILKNGEVMFLRQGDDFHFDECNADLTLLIQTLGGEAWQLRVSRDPRSSMLRVMPSTLRKEYDVAAIGDIPVLDPSLLDMCFEDLADDTLTVKLTVLKVAKTEDTKGDAAKRRRLSSCAGTQRRESEDSRDAIWEGILAAYRREIAAPILVDEEQLQTPTPFLVSKLMAEPIDIFIRLQKNSSSYRARTPEWTLVKLQEPLASISSGSTTDWRTLQAQENERGDFVCLQCIGHDSNSKSFDLRLHAFGSLWNFRALMSGERIESY